MYDKERLCIIVGTLEILTFTDKQLQGQLNQAHKKTKLSLFGKIKIAQ